MQEAVTLIEAKPAKHRKHQGRDVRKCRVKRFPYTVYFVELDDLIWIAAVAHDSRRPDYWAAREPED